jgi:hypothetical protein
MFYSYRIICGFLFVALVVSCSTTPKEAITKPIPGKARMIHGIVTKRGSMAFNVEAITFADGVASPNNFWRWDSIQAFDLEPGTHLLTIKAQAFDGLFEPGGWIWKGHVNVNLEAGKCYRPRSMREGMMGYVWLEDKDSGKPVGPRERTAISQAPRENQLIPVPGREDTP